VTRGITQCYLPPDRGDIQAFTTVKAGLVLDLATPEGCKAELTFWLVTSVTVTQRRSPNQVLTGPAVR